MAITHGDTNGIGYEIIFKAFAEPAMLELCTPIVYGSPKVAAYHRNALGVQANFTIINSAEDAHSGKLNLRMPSELHSRVAAFVASTGTTINDFINKAIVNELKHECAMQ